MESIAAFLSAWIALQTGLSVPPPPRIVRLDPKAMQEAAAVPDSQLERLRALYGRGEQVIYMRTGWNPERLRDKSELVHELAHHFQNVHALTYQCDAQREELAYDLQVKWLREQGVMDPYDLIETNAFYIVMVSVCRDAHHD